MRVFRGVCEVSRGSWQVLSMNDVSVGELGRVLGWRGRLFDVGRWQDEDGDAGNWT